MIIENVLARISELEAELTAAKIRLAQVEEVVAGLHANATTEPRSAVTAAKSATTPVAAAKSSR